MDTCIQQGQTDLLKHEQRKCRFSIKLWQCCSEKKEHISCEESSLKEAKSLSGEGDMKKTLDVLMQKQKSTQCFACTLPPSLVFPYSSLHCQLLFCVWSCSLNWSMVEEVADHSIGVCFRHPTLSFLKPPLLHNTFLQMILTYKTSHHRDMTLFPCRLLVSLSISCDAIDTRRSPA